MSFILYAVFFSKVMTVIIHVNRRERSWNGGGEFRMEQSDAEGSAGVNWEGVPGTLLFPISRSLP